MSIDLMGLDKTIQEEIRKLDQNLDIFNELQKETEAARSSYEKVKADLKELEEDSKNRIDMFKQQMTAMLAVMKKQLQEVERLKGQLNREQREFITLADKRMEEQEAMVLDEVHKTGRKLADAQESVMRDMVARFDQVEKRLTNRLHETDQKMEAGMKGFDVALQAANKEMDKVTKEIAALNKSLITIEVMHNNLQSRTRTSFTISLMVAAAATAVAIGAYIIQ